MCRRMRHLKPREIQGCQLALDASISTSLYDATSGGSLVAADGAVARWEDQSGNGRNFTQSVGASSPLRRVRGLNGVDTLEFDGSNDRMGGGTTGIFRNVSFGVMHTVSSIDSVPAQPSVFGISVTSSGNTRANIAYNSGPVAISGGRRLDGNSYQYALESVAVAGSAHVRTSIYDYANSDLFVRANGAQTASNTSYQTAGSTSDTDSLYSSVGSNPIGGADFFDGKISEVCMFGVALTMSQVMRLEHSRMRKWRING